MNNTASITRKLKVGGLALVAAGTLALSATAAEAAPSKVEGSQATAFKAAHGKKQSSKTRKRCKASKIAQRRHGRVRCVRRPKGAPAPPQNPKPAPAQHVARAYTFGGNSLVPTNTYTSPSVSISGSYFEERYMGCTQVYPLLDGGQYFLCYKLGYGAGNVPMYRYSWFYKRASSSSAWAYWFEGYY